MLKTKRFIRRLLFWITKEHARQKAIEYYTKRNHKFVKDLDYPFSFEMLDILTGLPLRVAISNFYPSKRKLRSIKQYPIPSAEKVIFYANANEHQVFAFSAFSPVELLHIQGA